MTSAEPSSATGLRVGIGPRLGQSSALLHLVALLLAMVPALAGTRRGLVVPGFRISEIIIVALLAIAILRFHKNIWLGGRVFVPLCLYAIVTMLVVAYHVTSRSEVGLRGFTDSALGPAIFLMLYLTSLAYGRNIGLMTLVLKYTFGLASLMGILGMLQALRLPAALNLAVRLTGNAFIAQPLDWKVPRSVGIYNSWHAYSSYMCLTLVLLVACYTLGVTVYRRRSTHILAIVCLLGGLLSSLTFGMIILGLVISSILLWKARMRMWIPILSVTAYVATTLSPLSQAALRRLQMQESTVARDYGFLPQTVAFRVEVWTRDYLPLISKNPIFGYGPITEFDRTFSYVESMYILVLLSGGILTLGLFLWFLLSAVLTVAPRTWGNEPTSSRAVGIALFYFLAGLIPLMLIHPYLNDAGSSQMVFLLLGLYCARSTKTTELVSRGYDRESRVC